MILIRSCPQVALLLVADPLYRRRPYIPDFDMPVRREARNIATVRTERTLTKFFIDSTSLPVSRFQTRMPSPLTAAKRRLSGLNAASANCT
jgi:hypothetical protein